MPVDFALLHPDVIIQVTDLINALRRRRILVVTDTIVSFGSEHDPANLQESYFGMGHLMSVLETVASVTRAHRTTDPLKAPNVKENFRFDDHELGGYGQIWLLGYDSGPGLSPAEVDAISDYMNNGGGVFATGDHATLGSALCRELPRVRSMRRWAAPPPPLSPERVDTTVPDHVGHVVFENQSDDIPQRLQLKWYPWRTSHLSQQVYPHPLLCSSNGAITEFPDHMHEGEVVKPSVLDDTMTSGGTTFAEYPLDPHGDRVVPEVVAWGWSGGYVNEAVMDDVHTGNPDASRRRWTGTVGAYDGWRAGVGRVVVDSTWHHFFDINLVGDHAATRPSVTDPRAGLWSKGFTYSPEGRRVLAGIDQYFKNIVHWLVPQSYKSLFTAMVLDVATDHRFVEVLAGQEAAEDDLHTLGDIAKIAWKHLLFIHPPCTIILINRHLLDRLIRIKRPFPPDPWWWPEAEDPLIPPVPPIEVMQHMFAGAVMAVHRMGVEAVLSDGVGERIEEAAYESGVRAVRLHLERARRTAEDLDEMLHNAG